MRVWSLALLLALTGCYTNTFEGLEDSTPEPFDDDDVAGDDDDVANDDDVADDDDSALSTDSDGDGVPDDEDCAPEDSSIHPGAEETCDGVDQNCNGAIDEGIGQNWFEDTDGDGWGDPATQTESCAPPSNDWVGQGQDCDDTDPSVHPGSPLQIDGMDSDCDGARDWEVTVSIAVDDAFEWCVDDETNMITSNLGWNVGETFTTWLESGQHVIGIRGWDLGQVITAAIAHISITDGSEWVTDSTWTYDPMPAAPADSRGGWCQVGFDDSTWQGANVIGPIGTAPWGNAPSVFPAGSSALWIWDHFPVNLNTQYLRKQITLP